jgi:Flp pilus assembly protein TadB
MFQTDPARNRLIRCESRALYCREKLVMELRELNAKEFSANALGHLPAPMQTYISMSDTRMLERLFERMHRRVMVIVAGRNMSRN